MNTFFLFNNLHFALEILGALAFFMVAWLAFDAFLLRKDFLTASRGLGFFALTVWQIIHAFGESSDTFIYWGFVFYTLGLVFVFLNLILEHPIKRPRFEVVFVLPALATTAFYGNILAAVLCAAITGISFHQYSYELKKALKLFWLGFLFLSAGAILSIFYKEGLFNLPWILGHIFEAVGFASLILWVWQYLQLRIREEMILIFTSTALLISIVVTLVFSIILIGQIEVATKANLLTNAKVLDLYATRLKEEALAKVDLFTKTGELDTALRGNDFVGLEQLVVQHMEKEKLGFLLVTDKNGEVVIRAHALTQKEDNLSTEKAVGGALSGDRTVEVEYSSAEKFSIRAASPIISRIVVDDDTKSAKNKEELIGSVVGGFLLDNALVDNIKRITGLEMSIWDGDKVAATTILNPDGRTRGTGIKLTDENVRSLVLDGGEAVVVRTEILSRPAIAAYLPIKNSDGEIVGMVSSLKPQQDILALANATNRLTLIAVAILMLILALPIYLITRRLSGEVV